MEHVLARKLFPARATSNRELSNQFNWKQLRTLIKLQPVKTEKRWKSVVGIVFNCWAGRVLRLEDIAGGRRVCVYKRKQRADDATARRPCHYEFSINVSPSRLASRDGVRARDLLHSELGARVLDN